MWPVLLLFVGGIVLIFAEFLLPGAVLGVIGGLMIIASMVLGWVWYPEYGLFIFGGEIVGTILSIVLGFYVMSRTKLGKILVMGDEQSKEAGYMSPVEDPALVGQLLTVHTALRPSGTLMHNGRRIDAVSDGTFIDAGKTVRVIEVEGHRVVCEEVADAEAADD